ncbi:P-loop containing nucleoside triphosphate hydrolase protein [Gilbertella persicaria]|uniref:P-loop containing nucleoside triphosphate hydrolase protein n=1 Tax=Gilbertella persicaria TaxID=101096 RepID=UPI002220B37F|nr:P-loop containing nucleoside triphosphate hydrolase protein [Gilbertella persicaria]KAI8069110.1 P-loop containing nucleoside triphosphate hydrolase protein [Gilbertella persicaria]
MNSTCTKRIKLVIVGDKGCGKTSLISVFANHGFPRHYIPAIHGGHAEPMQVDRESISLGLWDTEGQADYDRLRPLYYPNAHVLLLCFAIDAPDSLDNVQEKWIRELETFCPEIPIVLVGCKLDLRQDERTLEELEKISQGPVEYKQGLAIAKTIGAKAYMECSAKLDQGVQELFYQAAKLALDYQETKMKTKAKCVCQ